MGVEGQGVGMRSKPPGSCINLFSTLRIEDGMGCCGCRQQFQAHKSCSLCFMTTRKNFASYCVSNVHRFELISRCGSQQLWMFHVHILKHELPKKTVVQLQRKDCILSWVCWGFSPREGYIPVCSPRGAGGGSPRDDGSPTTTSAPFDSGARSKGNGANFILS